VASPAVPAASLRSVPRGSRDRRGEATQRCIEPGRCREQRRAGPFDWSHRRGGQHVGPVRAARSTRRAWTVGVDRRRRIAVMRAGAEQRRSHPSLGANSPRREIQDSAERELWRIVTTTVTIRHNSRIGRVRRRIGRVRRRIGRVRRRIGRVRRGFRRRRCRSRWCRRTPHRAPRRSVARPRAPPHSGVASRAGAAASS